VVTRRDCCDRGLHDMSSSSEAPVAGNLAYLGLSFIGGYTSVVIVACMTCRVLLRLRWRVISHTLDYLSLVVLL